MCTAKIEAEKNTTQTHISRGSHLFNILDAYYILLHVCIVSVSNLKKYYYFYQVFYSINNVINLYNIADSIKYKYF